MLKPDYYFATASNDAVVFVRSFRFTCECAERAKQQNYDYIGIEFYGECWAGMKDFKAHGPSEDCKMIKEDECTFDTCDEKLNGPRKCVGGPLALYVYEVNEKRK